MEDSSGCIILNQGLRVKIRGNFDENFLASRAPRWIVLAHLLPAIELSVLAGFSGWEVQNEIF